MIAQPTVSESLNNLFMRIELVYFEGCPHVATARVNLRAALHRAGLPLEWVEWDLAASSTPPRLRRHPSPTVLIDRSDVSGGGADASAIACRADAVPSVASILEHLARLASGEANE